MSNKRRPVIHKTEEEEKPNLKEKKLPEKSEKITGIQDEDAQKLKSIRCLKCGEKNKLMIMEQNNNLNLLCNDCDIEQIEANPNKSADINDFFVSLVTFMQLKDAHKEEQFSEEKVEALEGIINLIQQNKKQIKELQESISNLISNYTKPSQILNKLETTLIKYLSSQDETQKKELIEYLKEHFHFEKNKFHLSMFQSDQQKIKLQITSEYNLLKTMGEIALKVEQENKHYSLGDLNILNCPRKCVYNSFVGKRFNLKNYIQQSNQKITLISGPNDETQYYFDFNLDFDKKYIVLFQFDIIPQEQFTIGVAQKKNLLTRIAYDTPNCYFTKTFYPRWQPTNEECSNCEKGAELAFFPKIGQIMEMRISLGDNLVEFTDYPNRENINCNFDQYQFERNNEPYAIAFTLANQQQVSILSIQETTDFTY